MLLHDWLCRDENGKLLVLTAGLSCPRQNGKNAAIEALELYLLLTDPDTHILHTAHQVKTCKRAFNRLARVFSDKRRKTLTRLVKQIRRTNGEEGIYLWHPDHIGDESWPGASIEYSARSRSAARGFDKISVIVYDEAQELTDEQVEALLFTLGASDTDRFVLYTGTPPGPGCPGEVFTRVRQRALTDPTPRTAWHEWGIEDMPKQGSTFEDVLDLIYETNPAMGKRLSIEFTEEEFANTALDGFARERLGRWTPLATISAAIPKAIWDGSVTGPIADRFQGRCALGVKFSPDGSHYAVAGCKARRDKSHYAFELVECGAADRGLKALAEALAQRADTYSCVVIDGLNGAPTLCDHLNDMSVPLGYVVRPNTNQVVASAQELVDGMKTKTVLHPSDPLLDTAAKETAKRPVGDSRKGGWLFDGTEMEACGLAVWGARHSTRNPTRRQRLL